MMEILLASTSPARRALMDALRLPYRAVAPGVDEAVPAQTRVRGAVALLARRKAEAVRSQSPKALVIGADQLVDLDGRRVEKPADLPAARAQLRSLLGRTHEILTGVCVLWPGGALEEVDIARVTFYGVADDELERYLATEEWHGCAGGYRIEGAGQALVEHLEGDRTSVQGLPMIRLVRMLRAAGVAF
jgi:septum formation protein